MLNTQKISHNKSCHIYDNDIHINRFNIDKYTYNDELWFEKKENNEKSNIQKNENRGLTFEYINSNIKCYDNNIIFGEFTIQQFIKYLILDLDKNNLVFTSIYTSTYINIIQFIETNICTKKLNSKSNMNITLSTSLLMENINFLFLFNNALYEYKTNNITNDIVNCEDGLKNKIIIICDQFIYLLINHTLKIILSYSVKHECNEQYEKISSLLIYRLSKLIHNQLTRHVQMNIYITKYLTTIKEIQEEIVNKCYIESNITKKKINIYSNSNTSSKINSNSSSSSNNNKKSTSNINNNDSISNVELEKIDKLKENKNLLHSLDSITSLKSIINNDLNNMLKNIEN